MIGWSAGQFIISDLKLEWLQQLPELALFPCVAISLAIGIVATEIFLSNPTRPKRNLRSGWLALTIAAGLGLIIGLASGGITQILLYPATRAQLSVSSQFVRIVGWLLIGLAVGIAEGWTWRWRSVEAGDKRRFWQRLLTSAIASSFAALAAALIFEWWRQQLGGEIPAAQKGWEDPLGFSLLGALLGLVLSISTSPSYMVALRAGAGFEYIETMAHYDDDGQQTISTNHPRIQKQLKPRLKFVSDDYSDRIEEGLSIQLPGRGKKIRIGSGSGAHIYIPGLPPHVADLDLSPGIAKLVPNPAVYDRIELRGDRLTSARPIDLRHNDMIAFHADEGVYHGKKLFRFVYYNRFLDPQA